MICVEQQETARFDAAVPPRLSIIYPCTAKVHLQRLWRAPCALAYSDSIATITACCVRVSRR
jgi:hypothetical protein